MVVRHDRTVRAERYETMPIHDRWLILFALFAARTAMAIQFQTVGSAGPFLIDAFALDYTKLGSLIGLYMLPGIFIALPGGMLGQRFGAKRIVLAGLLLMAIGGALMGVSTSFAPLAAGRLISGVGAVLINVLMTKMIADWFAGRDLVTPMAIFIASWPLGLGIGLLLFTPLAAYSWSATMWTGALLSLASLVLVAVLYRPPGDAKEGARSAFTIGLSRGEWLAVSLAAFIWTVYNVGYIVLISFLPDLFGAHGYSLAQASGVVSFLGWTLIPAVPLSGYLAVRSGWPISFLAGGLAVSGITAALLPFVADPVPAFVVLALAVGVPGGLIMALPAQVLRPQNRAAGMGVFFAWYYAGMAVLPGFAGFARDVTGSAAAPALFAAAMMGVALAALAGFPSHWR